MKIRVFRIHLAKTLNYYSTKLAEKYGPIARSEAMKELIRLDAVKLQRTMARREPTNSWQVPVKVEFMANGQFHVLPEDENKILIID
jgi:hypothetical protein